MHFAICLEVKTSPFFSAYVWGVILCAGRHTVSGIYLAGQPKSRYWSLVEALGASALAAFASIVRVLPSGLIIFDRGFNNRKYVKILLAQGHHLFCPARKNAAFYYLPLSSGQPQKGRKKIYGRRVPFTHWTSSFRLRICCAFG